MKDNDSAGPVLFLIWLNRAISVERETSKFCGASFGHKRRTCSRTRALFPKYFTLSGCVLKIEWHELFTGNWKQEKYFNFPPKHKRHNPTNRCRWRPSFGAKETFLSPKYNVWVQSIIFSTARQLSTSKCHKYVNIGFGCFFLLSDFVFLTLKKPIPWKVVRVLLRLNLPGDGSTCSHFYFWILPLQLFIMFSVPRLAGQVLPAARRLLRVPFSLGEPSARLCFFAESANGMNSS